MIESFFVVLIKPYIPIRFTLELVLLIVGLARQDGVHVWHTRQISVLQDSESQTYVNDKNGYYYFLYNFEVIKKVETFRVFSVRRFNDYVVVGVSLTTMTHSVGASL